MNISFTKITDKELNQELYQDPINYIFKPYKNIKNFTWDVLSMVVLPCYYLGLAILVLGEIITSLSSMFYYFIKSNKTESIQFLNKSKQSTETALKIIFASIFIAPFMLIILLFRFVITIISFSYKSSNIEKRHLTDLTSQKKEILSNIEHLIDTINEDLSLINQLLDDSNAQLLGIVKDYTEKRNQESVRLQSTHQKYFMFKESENMITLKREKSTNSELNNTLQELIGNYPKITLDEKSTLDEIKYFHNDLDEHHNKVIRIAEELFPSSSCIVNLAKRIKDNSLKMNHGGGNV